MVNHKSLFISLLLMLTLSIGSGQNHILFHYGNQVHAENIENIDSISFPNGISIVHTNLGGNNFQHPVNHIDSITFSHNSVSDEDIVYITWNEDDVTIINPYANRGVSVTHHEGHVEVIATSGLRDIIYQLSGSTSDGSLSISSDKRFTFILDNVSITNPDSAAIKVQLDVRVTMQLQGINTLTDASINPHKGTIDSKGQLIFYGNGTLIVNGNANHAIFSSDYIRIHSGTIIIPTAANDGLHGDYFQMYGGTLQITAQSAGIDGDTGFIEIEGGDIHITTPSAAGKSIKCDSTLTIKAGNVVLTVSGQQAKGLKSNQSIMLLGGEISITCSGGTVVSNNTPAYCTAIKSGGDVVIKEGVTLTILCTSSNNGGKGISADGDVLIEGGNIEISTAGNGSTYTNTSNQSDAYTSACMVCDGNMTLKRGNIICRSTGSGGKGIKCDGQLTIGETGADNAALVLDVATSGEHITVSGGTWGPPGGQSGNYANPKGIKSQGDMIIHSGTLTINCTQNNEGGEGIESKATLTIHGGNLDIYSKSDDAINAATRITINGGTIAAISTNNDGIDSNGDIYINGGLTIASGARAPEEGFDCDRNTFKITGGTIVGTGGATSDPSSSCTQKCIKYTGTAGSAICIYNSNNEAILTFQLPTFNNTSGGGGGWPPGGGGGSSMIMLFSDPNITTGSYTLKYGGTLVGGSDFHGYYTGATYNGGSSKSFSVGSSVTTTVQ